MRVGIIGGGSIARLFIEHIRRGDLGATEIVAIAGRSERSRGRPLAQANGIAFVTGAQALAAQRPEVVVVAASHEAVREYAAPLLERGIGVIVLSGGALCDDALRERLERAAAASGALLHVPSGGICGLDALKAACIAGVDAVTITVTKPPAAWKNIPFVGEQKVDLDRLAAPHVFYDGPARQGVPLFPQNVNIAAVLSMAGIGFDHTRLKVVADPGVRCNTHHIEISGRTGRISIQLQNVPAPDNPKTAWLACYSALAALKLARSPVRYGT
jgi:aspartate dehydrogenase